MRTTFWLGLAAASVTGAVTMAACGGVNALPPNTDAGTSPEGSVAGCVPCVHDSDCGGQLCGKFNSGFFCAPSCQILSQCNAGTTCVPNEGTTGATVGICVANSGACGATEGVGLGGSDASSDALPSVDASAVCSQYAAPDQAASCPCPGGQSCQSNGCQFGEWCNSSIKICSPPPLGCGGVAGGVYNGGPAPTGTVTAAGGSVSRLYFAVIGDTRPPNEDDTPGYPTGVITKIFADIQALVPRPTFGLSTGDYQYASPTGDQSTPQLQIYLGARAQFTNLVFPTMGNHECTGATASNCGPGSLNGITPNYTNFLNMFLAPLKQTLPYYEIDINASDGSWTSKFLYVAANAWNQTQANWLDTALARTTTYTFLVRHEGVTQNTAPGVNPAENIMATHPYTLSLVGHVHAYDHQPGTREVTIGNGGAPLGGAMNYGYGMISQQSDGSIAVDMLDYESGLADPSFHFSVKADGTNL